MDNISTVYIQLSVLRYEAGANATLHFMPRRKTKGWRQVKALRSSLMLTRPEFSYGLSSIAKDQLTVASQN